MAYSMPCWRGVGDRPPQLAGRGQTTAIPHHVYPWGWDPGGQLLQAFQRSEFDTPGAIGPGPSEGVGEIAIGVLCQTVLLTCGEARGTVVVF
jgi:hypothetical protein